MSKQEWSPNKKLLLVFGVFLAAYFIPWEAPRLLGATNEAFLMLGEYAQQHVLLCLVPAMFIAGAITVFLNQQAVMRYLGPDANRLTAYGVASVSGAILAVCSCTVLPIFKGIYKKGAGSVRPLPSSTLVRRSISSPSCSRPRSSAGSSVSPEPWEPCFSQW